jgi:hypothetical protein
MRGFMRTASLDPSQTGEQVWRRDLLDSSIANPGKNIALEASNDVVRIAVRPAACMAAEVPPIVPPGFIEKLKSREGIAGREFNPRHADFQSAALPTELPGQWEGAY